MHQRIILLEVHMRKSVCIMSSGFFWVDYPKPPQGIDDHVVDILKIDMYLLYKIVECWFWDEFKF